MATTQIHGDRQIKPGTVSNGVLATNAAVATSKLADGAEFLKRDGSVVLTGDLDAGTSYTIKNLQDPTVAQEAATKAYVDATAQGLDVKASVRVATTAAGTLATSFENLDVIDGVTLATGDRILIKNQTTGAENGIYVVQATGAPVRSTDADVSAEVTPGMFTFIEQGTANGDTGWVLITDAPIVLGTTALVFTQFTGVGQILAGTGLTKTLPNTIDVVAANASIDVQADSVAVAHADASTETVTGGIRVKLATNVGDVYIGTTTTRVATPTTLSGDIASITGAGVVTVSTTIFKENKFVTRETPTGAIDGTNVTFTLAATPNAGSEEVFLNGILQEPGAGNDYTISGNTITYGTAPIVGDRLRVNYRK